MTPLKTIRDAWADRLEDIVTTPGWPAGDEHIVTALRAGERVAVTSRQFLDALAAVLQDMRVCGEDVATLHTLLLK